MRIKIYTGCGEAKDAEADFSWSIRGIKRHPRCKKCRNDERLERYGRNKEAELAFKFDRQVRKREEAGVQIATCELKNREEAPSTYSKSDIVFCFRARALKRGREFGGLTDILLVT
jgi:hypothetical protein